MEQKTQLNIIKATLDYINKLSNKKSFHQSRKDWDHMEALAGNLELLISDLEQSIKKYEYSKNGILSIQERMSTYIEDYIIRPCEDMLGDCWNKNYSYDTWQELYNLIKEHGDKGLKEYADYWYPYILGYKTCEFDKEYNNEN